VYSGKEKAVYSNRSNPFLRIDDRLPSSAGDHLNVSPNDPLDAKHKSWIVQD